MKPLLVLAALMVPVLPCVPQQLEAQTVTAGSPYRPEPFQRFEPDSRDTDSPSIRPTYWVEGGAIGAGALGALVAVAATALCATSEVADGCTGTTIGGFVVGGGMGFVVGALLGGLVPKGTGQCAVND